MADFIIETYSPEFRNDWNNFIGNSKNGTFLFHRDYMEYHADRFPDHSLMIFRNGKLYALLPGCRLGDSFTSHAGLTYGGLVLNRHASTEDILDLFPIIRRHVASMGCSRFLYSPTPHIYHTIPSEEDLYALFRNGAVLFARKVSSVINLHNRLKFRDIRMAGIRKASRAGVTVRKSENYSHFWEILTDNLMRAHNATPVHSLEEIMLLARKFPKNIELFEADIDGMMVAGTVVYSTPLVAHTQYISASPEGKETGALDLLFSTLINEVYHDRQWFDFGTSNEHNGQFLNRSLIYQKEGFGARAVCYDTYHIPTSI